MDPITAFSLACGVVQLVDFSLKVLFKSREIYQNGSLEENDRLEYLTHHLSDLKLEAKVDNRDGQLLPQAQQDLKDLADKCSETAQDLLKELAELKVADPKKKSQVIRASLRSFRKRSTLKEIEERLNSYRDALNARILLDLRENNTTRDFIAREIKNLEIRTAEMKHQEDFLASLYFPEINCREEEITEAHEKTYQWIFDQSGERVRPWSNFVDWLQNGSGTYWISGKPGSGKSTLIGYIYQDKRTKDALNEWASDGDLLIPAFFFWAAGTPLQKSATGLLRSLIYQILTENRHLISTLGESGITPELQRLHPQGSESKIVWTEKRLFNLFWKLVQWVGDSCSICVFIDGLDEADSDHYELSELITKLAKQKGVKCCVSSRPEKPFQQFESSSMLRLQDLTRSDIEEYVHTKLGKLPQIQNLSVEDQERKLNLFKQVVDKAEGVFLWVELVVKSQIIGVHFNDSFETLKERLDSLPPKVEDLYSNMLKRIDPAHYNEFAKYLYFAISLMENWPSIFHFTLAMYGLTDDVRLKSQKLDSDTIVSKCPYVYERINAICGGFLETYEISDSDSEEEEYWLRWEQDASVKARFEVDWSRHEVRFCHRTALDFFNEIGENGTRFMTSNIPPSLVSHCDYLNAAVNLAHMSMCNLLDPKRLMFELIENTMIDISWRDTHMSDFNTAKAFLKYLDETISIFDQRLNRPPDGSHWCMRWGSLDGYRVEGRMPQVLLLDISPDADSSENSPNDFLTFAASHDLSKYVIEVVNQPGFKMSSAQANRLAICMTAIMHDKNMREWRISHWSQLESLATLGAIRC